MNEKKGMPERVGRTINELDIDFSRFNLLGWFISILSLGLGGGLGYAAYRFIDSLQLRDERGAPLAFGFTMIGTTVLLFIGLRWIAHQSGASILKPRPPTTL